MRLDSLIDPRSIAVVGASERPSIGRSVVENLQLMAFDGPISCINPRYESVLGLTCVPALTDLDEPPDVVVFCVGSRRVIDGYRQLPEIGARAAVIFDGGFAEADDDGRRLQAEIVGISREASIALCGPNCMGLLNPSRGSGTYAQLTHDPGQLPGNVAVVSQSGSMCIGLMTDTRRFGFSVVISSGNEAVVTTADYMNYLVDDPATRVIATFTESVSDPENYVAALDRAAEAGKPVVVLKVGRTARAQRAITSHTGGLSGESRVFSEVLRSHRAIEVSELDELTEVLAVCQGTHWPSGNRVSLATASGGMAELVLDTAPRAGVELPPLSDGDRALVEDFMGPVSGDGNPLDAWGNGEFMENLPRALEVASASDDVDAVVFANDAFDGQPMGGDGILGYSGLLAQAAASSVKPHYQLNTRPGLMHRKQVAALAEVGCVTIGGLRQGLAAISRMATFVQWAPRPELEKISSQERVAGLLAGGVRTTINEHDSKQVLADYGIPVTEERVVFDPAEAATAADAIGFPIALKAVSDEIPHKSDAGLVVLGISDQVDLSRAWTELRGRIDGLAGASDIGFLVQEMVEGGVEVLAGVSCDASFGLTLAFGMGGIAAEVFDDVALRSLPLREGDAAAMIDEVRGSALLAGYRGAPAGDRESLIDCLEALAGFAWAERDHIAEIDLNPVAVMGVGKGCVAVDALIVPKLSDEKGTHG